MSRAPIHAAIIMDGNGRWARRRGLPRTAGHRQGADAVTAVVEAAPGLGVDRLTLFAFSSDNWRRPRAEIGALMALFRSYLDAETERCLREGVRLGFIGRRDRIAADLERAMAEAERRTAGGERLHLRIAVDYSGREAILRAARRALSRPGFSAADFGRLLAGEGPGDRDAAAVDLLIRTGGERRLSDFLLWECAYAELFFTDVMWPDFDAAHLERAVAWFHGRKRRFGRVPDEAASEPAPAVAV